MNDTTEQKPNGSNGNGKKDSAKGNGKAKVVRSVSEQIDRREILAALRALRRGDFNVHLRGDTTGIDGQIAETFNEIVDMVRMIKDETADVSIAVGKYGQAQRRV